MESAVELLASLPGVALCPSANADSLRSLLASSSLKIAQEHLNFLGAANGAMAFGGYFRLFGVGCTMCQDLRSWNRSETWKFAWNTDLDKYLCFGETAWGDQFAYDVTDLQAGSPAKILFLNSINLQAEVVADSFGEFLGSEFIRSARQPYDETIAPVREKVGDLTWDEHVVYSPSPAIGGPESLENVMKMPSKAAMIIAGDIATQCGLAKSQARLRSVQPYVDTNGRTRIKLNWF